MRSQRDNAFPPDDRAWLAKNVEPYLLTSRLSMRKVRDRTSHAYSDALKCLIKGTRVLVASAMLP